ncbi:MAG: ATP-binding cassette domain-containing protein, partial [Clostridia bacterium]
YGKKEKETAENNIKLLHLNEIKKRCYRDLSGGQQQRVLLARALCATKKLLILDEPVNGLDPVASSDLYHHIRDINVNQGITLIMVSHDVQRALDDATHILHMHSEKPFYSD